MKRNSFAAVTAVLLPAAALLLFCRPQRFHAETYFPLEKDAVWVFSGDLNTMKVTHVESGVHGRQWMVTFYDSLGLPLWSETYRSHGGQIYWTAFSPQTTLLPQITFDPPLYAAPFSDVVGETRTIESVEHRVGPVEDGAVPISVEYHIMGLEDVQVPAGLYHRCIKMKVHFTYPDSIKRPYFVGDHYYWYAPDVGPVKYDLPTSYGELLSHRR